MAAECLSLKSRKKHNMDKIQNTVQAQRRSREHVKLRKYGGGKYLNRPLTLLQFSTAHFAPVFGGRALVRKACGAHHAHTFRVALRILDGVPVILQHR